MNSNQIIVVRYLLLNIIHYFLTLAGKGRGARGRCCDLVADRRMVERRVV